MARFFLLAGEYPLADQLKTLGDDELLDFWEETQYLERFLDEEYTVEVEESLEYERIILQELQLRSCQRSLCAPQPPTA
ncbi:hypothetical protein [Megalodesulfovibrio gigas]|uniref:Uncharacterized protein n=1 Tax=Megalodesulfovibrio gigas (strain ATCC 19364 / DSM 1382 / NCIMB 9332 / VKM B-1759) TaxID=1121448 RepID=T2GC47_MEGG1|nr:hypothetical protein [Megalodesulfovibrio gigas]AGW13487.1 hypothetical protein DGI_1664 [Megalodesulfovibrio gigas DSM 1382 = ATCC 19364]